MPVRGLLLGIAFLTLALADHWAWAPAACPLAGLGFYQLHNSLQTQATQLAPEARGTAVSLFAACFFLAQAVGVGLGARIIEQWGVLSPSFAILAGILPLLGWYLAYRLSRMGRRFPDPQRPAIRPGGPLEPLPKLCSTHQESPLMTIKVLGYATQSPQDALAPFRFERREPRPDDVVIEILYCGVCHSDLHQARDDWGGSRYPMVPGHEIIGRVVSVGPEVSRLQAGDPVGVGCMVDSCRHCGPCEQGLEQYCEAYPTFTYNGLDPRDEMPTYGGYSEKIVVSERFVLKIPPGVDLAGAAPLLCAGITTWSPLRHWGVGQGSRVGVIGLGGLGHMALKLAKALGAEVTLFTRSPGNARTRSVWEQAGWCCPQTRPRWRRSRAGST